MKLPEHTKFQLVATRARFVIWRMLGQVTHCGAQVGQLVSLIQIRIAEVAAAGGCFWYYAFVAGEEADCPWKAPISKSIRC